MNNIRDYTNWIGKYEWDAHVTVRLHGIPQSHLPRQVINDVLRPLEAISGQKIVALGTILPPSQTEQQHAHFVIRFTKTLPDITNLEERLLSRRSKIVSHQNAIRITQYLFHKTPAYLGEHMTRPGATVECYRQNLMRELLA